MSGNTIGLSMEVPDAGDSFDDERICQPGQENTGRWTFDEHRLFLQGLELHGKGWKQIATLIQTRTVVQIRTHAQKYFQKLSKAQASGTSHLDPATLMSTMDAGKARPASVARNLRSTASPTSAAETEGRLRSLRARRNRGRHPRHNGDDDDDEDQNSCDTASSRSRSRSSCSGSGESYREYYHEQSEQEMMCDDQDLDDEGLRQDLRSIAAEGGLVDGLDRVDKSEDAGILPGRAPPTSGAFGNGSTAMANSIVTATPKYLSPSIKQPPTVARSHVHGGSGASYSKQRRSSKQAGVRHSPKKSPKTSKTGTNSGTASAREGGAADIRALAWEAAAARAQAARAQAAAMGSADTDSMASAAPTSVTRERAEVSGHDLAVSGAADDLKRVGGPPQSTRISPTSVSDINSFMSFPVLHAEHSNSATHQLPPQLAPSWCTKPQDSWMSVAGFDGGGATDSDDAGPFRWFIDERSLSAPGAFFQPPAETWGGSDTTSASTSAGASSGGESMDGDCSAVVPDLPVCMNKVDASPGNSDDNAISTDHDCNARFSKRRRIDGAVSGNDRSPATTATTGGMIAGAAPSTARGGVQPASNEPLIPSSDAVIANEVNRHVEADEGDGEDITAGLWLDNPQEASSMLCGLGLSTPTVSGVYASLSLPSLDEEEVLAFLACEETRPASSAIQM